MHHSGTAGELDDPLLTVAEVASILKLNQQTVRNWIDAGSLPALHIGRRVRIKRSDFERLIAEGYRSATTSGANADRNVSRLRHPDSGESQRQRGAKQLDNAALWNGFGAAAANISETIADGSSDEIADAFRALAEAARALGDAIASQENS